MEQNESGVTLRYNRTMRVRVVAIAKVQVCQAITGSLRRRLDACSSTRPTASGTRWQCGDGCVPGTCLTLDKHRDVAVYGDRRRLTENLLQERTPSHNRLKPAGSALDRREFAGRGPGPGRGCLALQRPTQQIEVVREGEVVLAPRRIAVTPMR